MKIPNVLDLIFPSRKTIERYLAICERRRWIILTLALLLTVAGLFGTVDLYRHVDTSLTALLPDYYKSVSTLKRIDQEGARLYETVFIEGNSTDEIIRFAEDVADRLQHNPYVYRVKLRTHILPKRWALLTVAPDDLYMIRDRVKKTLARSKLKGSGFFVDLEEEIEGEENSSSPADAEKDLRFRDLLDMYPSALGKENTHDEYMISRDGKALLMQVYFQEPPSKLSAASDVYRILPAEVESVRQAGESGVDGSTLKITYHGPYRKRLDEYGLIKKEASTIGIVTMVAVLLSLLLYFQRLSAVIMVSIPLTMGLLWTMGLSDLLIGHLNTITAFLIGILSGLGVDYSIHFYSRYAEERHRGRSQREALADTIQQTGRAAFTSGLNTALVFLSLMLADFKGFSEFGLISGLGLMLCYFAIYLLLPVFVMEFEKHGWNITAPAKSFLGIPWPKMPTFFPAAQKRFPFARTLLWFTGIIVLLAVWILPKVEFEYDFGRLRSDLITYKAEENLYDRFNLGGPATAAALIVMDSTDDIASVRQEFERKMAQDKDSPTLRGFTNFHTLWPPPEEQEKRLAIIAEIRALLDDDAVKLLRGEDKKHAEEFREYLSGESYPMSEIPKEFVASFSPRNGPIGTYGYILARPEIHTRDGRDAMKFAEDAREFKTDRGTFYASSQEIVFADLLGLMLKESKFMVLVAILLIVVFVWMDFGSLKQTALVLVPLTSGMLLTMILLYSFGGRITFYNMIVIPLIIGMGEDNAVHLYHRYLEEGPGSIIKVLRSTGMATWMASITTVFGFLGLVFSSHRGLQSIGVLAAAGITGCLVCSLLVLPAMVQVYEDCKK